MRPGCNKSVVLIPRIPFRRWRLTSSRLGLVKRLGAKLFAAEHRGLSFDSQNPCKARQDTCNPSTWEELSGNPQGKLTSQTNRDRPFSVCKVNSRHQPQVSDVHTSIHMNQPHGNLYTHACIHMNQHTWEPVYTCMYTHEPTHMGTCIHMHAEVQSHSWLQSKFEASLIYMRPCGQCCDVSA